MPLEILPSSASYSPANPVEFARAVQRINRIADDPTFHRRVGGRTSGPDRRPFAADPGAGMGLAPELAAQQRWAPNQAPIVVSPFRRRMTSVPEPRCDRANNSR